MNDNMMDGGNHTRRKYFRDVINFLPQRPLKCLDLGSGIGFEFERMLLSYNMYECITVDCVDRIAPNKISKLPDKVNYIQRSVEDKLTFEEKYDCIFCFEVIEHVDNTDVLIQNCYNNLKDNGILFIAYPNLASLYSRIELLMGYQPHLLEISNEYANYGTGIFGRLNNPDNSAIHHIRGITYRAMKELLVTNRFKIDKAIGNDVTGLLRFCPQFATTVLFICCKNLLVATDSAK